MLLLLSLDNILDDLKFEWDHHGDNVKFSNILTPLLFSWFVTSTALIAYFLGRVGMKWPLLSSGWCTEGLCLPSGPVRKFVAMTQEHPSDMASLSLKNTQGALKQNLCFCSQWQKFCPRIFVKFFPYIIYKLYLLSRMRLSKKLCHGWSC